MGQLQEISPELDEMGVALVGISPDKPEDSKALASRAELTFPLVSDDGLALAREFGIVYGTRRVLPVPAVFVLGAGGTVVFHYVHPDYRIRLNPDLLLAAAKVAVAHE